jgi:hypothetical protein
MCQRVYVASRVELPKVRRGETSPYLEVLPPFSAIAAGRVRQLLDPELPFLHVAGGHVECGCGFPSQTTDEAPDPENLSQADVASLTALAEYVRPACSKYATVQLYLCWVNQEGQGPVSRRSATLDDLREAGFRLKHQEVLTLGRTLESRRRRTKG